ncbi:hypothetical protein MVEN_01888500 [Mycena venus]|uniref:Uncharacterized protein n=1 Tax=Mycena venus TaxID=2733690 RepID=A0A8H6XJK0_9AGAR|nr:hypothetical protein MVEN_01888500 [Mycena venus]
MADAVASDLPLDLERTIFELAAYSRPVCIPNLMRVAWRVKHWVEPALYRTLLINVAPRFYPIPPCNTTIISRVAGTPPMGHVVRNVMFTQSHEDDLDILVHACPHIENLYIPVHRAWLAKRFPLGFAALPLTHLYCDGKFLHKVLEQGGAFPRLTHLHLFTAPAAARHSVRTALARWLIIAKLPELTHLAVRPTSRYDLEPISSLLPACMSLRALVLLSCPMHVKPRELDPLANDPRFVLMFETTDYEEDWQRVDVFIAERRSGEIDHDACFS